jgi:hypothetical protein
MDQPQTKDIAEILLRLALNTNKTINQTKEVCEIFCQSKDLLWIDQD